MTRQPFYPFRSEQAKAEFEAHAREVAKAWPVASDTRLLDTPVGRTFVRVSGTAGNPPLILLSGARASSLMWIDTVAALSARHRTYAPDTICDAGFSVNRRTISTHADYVDWLDEVLAALALEEPPSLVGVSHGGTMAAQYALHYPERVRSVVLIAPGATVLRTSPGFFVRAMLLCIPRPGGNESALDRTLRWVFADAFRGDEACRGRLKQAVAEVKAGAYLFTLPRPPWPAVFTDEEWGRFRVPCLFLVGEHEKIYSARAAVRRLNRVAPQVKTEIFPGAGHDLTIIHPDRVTGSVLDFLAEVEERSLQSA
ncbi:MAG: alpha/beta hydrolase [Acidobacteriota bacterium]